VTGGEHELQAVGRYTQVLPSFGHVNLVEQLTRVQSCTVGITVTSLELGLSAGQSSAKTGVAAQTSIKTIILRIS
jgi:hypothetical protein